MTKVIYETEDELKHYGVLGMKWGVRRASRRLSKATTKSGRDRAINKLNKHKAKSIAKVEKLEKKQVKLQEKVDRNTQKNDVKAAKLNTKAAKLRGKKYGIFVSKEKADELEYKATKLEIKAKKIEALSNEAKTKLEANVDLKKTFETGIDNIDTAIADAGRRYFEDD